MDNHFPPVTLDGRWFGHHTRAHWARSPASRLIVFVHGFGGDPVTTWPEFPSVLRANPDLADCDFVFFGYDGLTTQANNSAALFDDFLSRYLQSPADIVNARQPVNQARAPFEYGTIVIVAHSLGAVVARRALLRAGRRPDSAARAWLPTVRLVLFAPAHCGAYAAETANAYLMSQDWWVAKLAGAVTQLKVPLLKDLERGSTLIGKLLDDTKAAAQGAASKNHLVATAVLWAENEYVVYNDDFFEDPLATKPYGTDHFSVCKPDAPSHDAVRAVLEHL